MSFGFFPPGMAPRTNVQDSWTPLILAVRFFFMQLRNDNHKKIILRLCFSWTRTTKQACLCSDAAQIHTQIWTHVCMQTAHSGRCRDKRLDTFSIPQLAHGCGLHLCARLAHTNKVRYFFLSNFHSLLFPHCSTSNPNRTVLTPSYWIVLMKYMFSATTQSIYWLYRQPWCKQWEEEILRCIRNSSYKSSTGQQAVQNQPKEKEVSCATSLFQFTLVRRNSWALLLLPHQDFEVRAGTCLFCLCNTPLSSDDIDRNDCRNPGILLWPCICVLLTWIQRLNFKKMLFCHGSCQKAASESGNQMPETGTRKLNRATHSFY